MEHQVKNSPLPRVHLIANERSGRGHGKSLTEIGQAVCDELGWQLIPYATLDHLDFEKQIERAVDACEEDGGVVIAAGGDGTIRGVAEKAAGRNVRFAVVPCGTFNFFARTHNIPEDHTEAFRLALTGETRKVRLGEVNGRMFLINASLGLYAKAIREREKATSFWGRHRLVVILSSLKSFLSGHRLMNVDLVSGNDRRSTRTPMIFIGNNALQLRDLKMDVARCMRMDMMAVCLLRPIKGFEFLRIIFRGFTKTLEEDDNLETFCVDELTIHTNRRVHTVALDGEIFTMSSPFNVRSLPQILPMVLPPKEV